MEESDTADRISITCPVSDVREVNLNHDTDIPIHVDNNRSDFHDLFSLLSSYMDKKFSGVREELKADLKASAAKKPKLETECVFKYESNKIQHKFNISIHETVEEIINLVQEGSVTRVTKKLKSVQKELETRNKLIKLADRSPAGWATVKEYLQDDLADDSGDERRIRQAESRAMQKKKGTTSNRGVKRPFQSQFRNDPQRNYDSRSNWRPNYQPYSTQNYSVRFQKQPKPTDICNTCGGKGHWSTHCSNQAAKRFSKSSL